MTGERLSIVLMFCWSSALQHCYNAATQQAHDEDKFARKLVEVSAHCVWLIPIALKFDGFLLL